MITLMTTISVLAVVLLAALAALLLVIIAQTRAYALAACGRTAEIARRLDTLVAVTSTLDARIDELVEHVGDGAADIVARLHDVTDALTEAAERLEAAASAVGKSSA